MTALMKLEMHLYKLKVFAIKMGVKAVWLLALSLCFPNYATMCQIAIAATAMVVLLRMIYVLMLVAPDAKQEAQRQLVYADDQL